MRFATITLLAVASFVVSTAAQNNNNEYLAGRFQCVIDVFEKTSTEFEIVEWPEARAELNSAVRRLRSCSNQLCTLGESAALTVLIYRYNSLLATKYPEAYQQNLQQTNQLCNPYVPTPTIPGPTGTPTTPWTTTTSASGSTTPAWTSTSTSSPGSTTPAWTSTSTSSPGSTTPAWTSTSTSYPGSTTPAWTSTSTSSPGSISPSGTSTSTAAPGSTSPAGTSTSTSVTA